MVMIFAFFNKVGRESATNGDVMESLNKFFLKLYSSPSLLWKLGASIIFIAFAIAIWIVPSLTAGLTSGMRTAFAVLLTFYGLFRFATFYNEFRRGNDE
jgi:hypothetical protein